MVRAAKVQRYTNETKIKGFVNLDGTGIAKSDLHIDVHLKMATQVIGVSNQTNARCILNTKGKL